MFRFGFQQYMFMLHVVDYLYYFYASLICDKYLANVHFRDIPHTFIPHFTLHSEEKNLHRIFRKLPLDNFPHSKWKMPPFCLQSTRRVACVAWCNYCFRLCSGLVSCTFQSHQSALVGTRLGKNGILSYWCNISVEYMPIKCNKKW